MPLRGGPADKFGARYEGRRTVLAMIDVLEGKAESIRLEPPGDQGAGVEFSLHFNGSIHYVQVKRQMGSRGRWTLGDLKAENVLGPFLDRLRSDERASCVFVSMHAAFQLDELSDAARRAGSWQEFFDLFLQGQRLTWFETLGACWADAAPEEIMDYLRRIRVETIDEVSLNRAVDSRLAVLVEGKEHAVSDVLSQLSLEKVHYKLVAAD